METFKFSDIETVYFCAGARNHKLKSLFKNAKTFYELDERSASFKALGAAKAGKVSAVCVTSGTAVAQCMGAMVEAYYSQVPFILVSGDRPKRLHGTAAAQTIDHFGVTKGYAGKQVEVLDRDLSRLELGGVKFPLHINALVDENHDLENSVKSACGNDLQNFVDQYEKTLFLVSHDNTSMREIVEALASKTDFVFAETLSWGKDISPIANEFELMKMFRAGAFDSIVRIGHTPLSKLWRVVDTKDIPVFSLDPRGLAGLSRGEVCSEGYESLLKLKIKKNAHQSDFNWGVLEKYPLSQLSWMKKWQNDLPENSIVYLGNSSVIRDFEAVQTKNLRTYGNRGANGIDGQLSTAIGIADHTDENVYCLLGDLTFLYDYTSSFDLPENLKLVVLDNQGGRIFERIGINDEIILSSKSNLAKLGLGDKITVAPISPEQTLACFKDLMQ